MNAIAHSRKVYRLFYVMSSEKGYFDCIPANMIYKCVLICLKMQDAKNFLQIAKNPLDKGKGEVYDTDH